MSAALYTFHAGSTPLLIDVPHAGTYLPPHLRAQLSTEALALPDTDWHVHLLYQFALEAGASLMAATHSRYVIDLNRDPDGASLYPGADTTELCPTRSFAGEPIYREGMAPTAADIAARRQKYWAPYHTELRRRLEELRERHGYALLLDGHSIRAHVPRFFDGRLPDLNLGTADGRSCAPALQEAALGVLRSAADFTHVLNGRFKGGYITRRYGRPAERVHALQLEIAQECYMDEAPPYAWEAGRARGLVAVLRQLVRGLLAWRP